MKKANTVKVVREINELEAYKGIVEQIKLLEVQKEAIRKGLFAQMDALKADEIVVGKYKAVRAVTFQERLDTAKVKEFLGDRLPQFSTRVEQVRLTVL